MSFNLATGGKRRFTHARRSGSAFIVEALFLLVFLCASAAVFTQLFAHAANQASEGLELSRAVAVASDAAERFAADPEGVEDVALEDGFLVTCEVTAEPVDRGGIAGDGRGAGDTSGVGTGGASGVGSASGNERGTLYHATIRVYAEGNYPETGERPDGKPTYELQTACYERGDAR